MNYYSPTKILDKDATGVIETIDVKKTLDIALQQNPNTKHIVVINDRTLTGIANANLLNSVIPTISEKVDFIFYKDMSMVEIQNKVSVLEKDTIVYLLSFNTDKYNNNFSYEESAELISSKSIVPVYGAWDFYLGHGIVGGMLTNGMGQGEMAAEMAKEVLNGKSIKDVAIVEGISNKYMFDYKVLEKYNISVSGLPEESIVINKPERLPLDKSKMIALFSFGVVLIIILFLLNYRKNYIIKTNTVTIKELEISAYTDCLTNLPNRAAGLMSLDEQINLSNQLGYNIILCFIDLNNLKNVNDRFGHNEGDTYLLTTTQVIREALNKDSILFRYGGDEFIVLFPDMKLDQAMEILMGITTKLEQFSTYNCKVNKCRYRLSLSYGFSEYIPGSNLEVGELIRNADEEMYKYKRLLKESEAKDRNDF